MRSRCPQGEFLVRSPSLAIDDYPSLCPHMAFCLSAHTPPPPPVSSPFLIRMPVLLDEGPTLMMSLNLIYLLKGLSPHTVTLGVRPSTYVFGGDTVQFVTPQSVFLALWVMNSPVLILLILIQFNN